MNKQIPKALFFDAAGTLIDLAEPVTEVYARHFSAAGFTTIPKTLASPLKSTFQNLPSPTYSPTESGDLAEQEWWRTLVAEVFLASHPTETQFLESPDFQALFEKLFRHYEQPSAWTVFDDVFPALETAQQFTRLGVLSNFDHRLRPILTGLGLADYFEHIISSSDARARKPAPQIFQYALEAFQLAPSEVAHAGDCPKADIQGAQNSGIQGFLVSRPETDLLDFLTACGIEANKSF